MNNNRFLELISRKFSGEATTEEIEEFNEMMSLDSAATERLNILEQFWNQHRATHVPVEGDFEKLKLKFDPPLNDVHLISKRLNKRFFFKVTAAASVLLIAGSLLFIKRNVNSTRQLSLVETKNSPGAKSNITMSDGTRVWLNTDSKIQYPKKFSGNTREVYLEGEAFFDVTKDAAKPFIIHLTNGTIRVLGTSFNVRAYKNEKMIEASVATGKVAFIPIHKSGTTKDTVFLTRNKKLRYLLAKEQAIVEPTVSKDDIAWIGGKLVFKAMSFDEISFELERTFGKKFIFLSDSARQFRLTGSFQNNSLDEILFYLSKSAAFTYSINNNEVMITFEGDSNDGH
jgi:transmembrane sensor